MSKCIFVDIYKYILFGLGASVVIFPIWIGHSTGRLVSPFYKRNQGKPLFPTLGKVISSKDIEWKETEKGTHTINVIAANFLTRKDTENINEKLL